MSESCMTADRIELIRWYANDARTRVPELDGMTPTLIRDVLALLAELDARGREIERAHTALHEIRDALGPNPGACKTNTCEGCKYEMQSALSSAEFIIGKRNYDVEVPE